MQTRWPLFFVLSIGSMLAACGPGALVPEETEPPSSGGSSPIQGDIGLGVELAALRGQNLVALELERRRETPEALQAVERAIEITQAIKNRAGSGGGPGLERLDRALEAAVDALERPDPAEDLDRALAEAGRATLDIESDVMGRTTDTAAYRASLVAALTNDSARRYEVAIESEPLELSEYRAAYGSLREARNLHESLTTLVEDNRDDRARASETVLSSMFAAMPESDPPMEPPPPDEVAAAAYMLGALLAERHGARAPPPADRLGFIPPLLHEVVATYGAGEAGVADIVLRQVQADLCCPQTPAGAALEDELGALAESIRSGTGDEQIAALAEHASELAEAAAG